ncbi:Endoplasmic reticulum membrane-associated RNA degradation protein isoform X1 [Aix galericulata]|nr:Endoplasmic reticulum membrane-associated RNA degradation protein isoform X1 [Aix galericulata]
MAAGLRRGGGGDRDAMALPGSVSTCLSSPVHYMICKLGFEKKDTYDINNIVSENGEVCWQAVTEHLRYLESDQSVDYIKSVQSLGPVCESVNLHFKSLTKDQFVVQYAVWFHWTNYTELFLEVFDVLQYAQATEVVLGLMKLTSCLERALGDVYLLIDLNHETLCVAEELVQVSNFVFKSMVPFWMAALTAFKQSRYADCVILLLPQLEAGLRLLFTTTNKCPNRLLTAEPSALYTTFDEEFLWDFLNHQEGPRIRDHLSHGEINLKTFPRELANQIVAFAITLLCRFSGEDTVPFKEHVIIKPLMTCASCYRSQFHPISRLKKQVLECMKSIHLWPELPTVSEEHVQVVKGLEGNTETSSLILKMAEILAQVQQYLPQDCCSPDDPINSVVTERLLVKLSDKHVCTLYSPRPVLEVLVVLRKICTQCHQVSEQVIASIELRYKQWMKKTLRSRQRHNYLRMLNSIKFLSPVLRLILLLITLEVINVHLVCKKTPSDYQQYLKFLKSVLQYTENLVTYTSPEKNKWDETEELTNKALIKIRNFSDRKLTLIQSAT